MNKKSKESFCKGFTLLELAISVVIIGLMIAGILSAYTVHTQKQQVDRTKSNIEAVNDAIASFVQKNGFYPCPAAPTDAAAEAGDCTVTGALPDGTDAATGYVSATVRDDGGNIVNDENGDPLRVRIGVIPVTVRITEAGVTRTEQLVSGDKAIDGWRNRIAYAVIEQMADPARDANVIEETGLLLQHSQTGDNLDTMAKFLVLSRGADGIGAYNTAGMLRQPCNGASQDVENCNADSLFLSIGIDGTRSLTADGNNFDDFVMGDGAIAELECKANQEMRGFNMRTRQPICVAKDTLCYETGKAYVGLKPDPTNPDGMIADCRYITPACGKGQVAAQIVPNSPPVCVPNNTGSCPAGSVVTGTNSDNTVRCSPVVTPVCSAGMVQVGFGEDGRLVCAPKSDAPCPAGHFMVGGTIGSPKCGPVPKTCEGAGKILIGVRNGQLVCDTSLKDQVCDPGDYIVAISAGQPVCGRPGGEPLYVRDIQYVSEDYDPALGDPSVQAMNAYNQDVVDAIAAWGPNKNLPGGSLFAYQSQCQANPATNGTLPPTTLNDSVKLNECYQMLCAYKTGFAASLVQYQGSCPLTGTCGGRVGFTMAFGCFYKIP